MSIKLKIPDYLLKFPKYLPNDIEGFIFYYPNKFPDIINKYEEAAQKYAMDPEGFRKYGDLQRDELWVAFRRILEDYNKGDQTDLSFLVEIDQRFHKMFCYRFWIVNYLFADGPIHEFYVDILRNSIRKFVDVTEEVEEFEDKVLLVQRDLLQSDYADYYLRQALDGVRLIKLLEAHPKLKEKTHEAFDLIDSGAQKNLETINALWSDIFKQIESTPEEAESKALLKELEVPLGQAKMRSSMLPIYNMMTHAAEFREENIDLEARYFDMKNKIDLIFAQAKEKLSSEEYDVFKLSYEMARNFSMYKDVIGNIDGELLPVWFGIHEKVQKILKKDNPYLMPRDSGHATMFYRLVWFLPPELKVRVMTPDFTPFDVYKV